MFEIAMASKAKQITNCLTCRGKNMKNNIKRIIRMTAFYSFAGLILQSLIINILFAASVSEAQNLREIKVNIQNVNITLEQAFQLLEKKTDIKFMYFKDDNLPLNETVKMNFQGESLYDILVGLAKDYNLTFNRINNQIVVKKNQGEMENIITNVETGSVKGYVTDGDTKEPLPGVTVALRGTTLGTYTDIRGYFELSGLKPGKYTITASYVGYSTSVKEINISSGKTAEVNFQLGQSALNLDEVIVTGSISERSIRESSNPITVISPKELENRDLSSLSSILQAVPGIVIGATADNISQGGRMFDQTIANMNIRGAGASVGNKIKIIVDGVELADQSMLTFLDPEQIEKIEIIRGPMGSTLYGAGSSEGIIQVFTKRGIGKLSVNFKSTFTSQESKYQDANPLNSQYALALNGSKGDISYNLGINYAVFPISRWAKNNGIDEKDWSFSGQVSGKIAGLKVDLNIMKGMSTAGYCLIDQYYKIALEQGWSNPTSSYLTTTYYDIRYKLRQVMTILNINHPISDNLYQNLNVSYSEINQLTNYYSAYKAYESSTQSYVYYYPSTNAQMIMTNAKYFLNWKEPFSDFFKIDLTAGFDISDRIIYSFKNYYTSPFEEDQTVSSTLKAAGYVLSQTSTTKAVFAEGVWGFWNDLFLTTGYRTENNNGYGDNTGWYSIPKVGLTYVREIGKFTLKPRISWGSSTQPVPPMYKVDKVTTQGSYTIWQVGNPELKPQTQQGWEFGGDIYYGSNYSINITYYHQKFENMVGQVTLTDPTVYMKYTFENIWSVINDGWEISARAIVNPFTIDVAYTHLTSKYGPGFPSASSNNTGNPEYHEGGRVINIPSGSLFIKVAANLPSILPWTSKGGNIAVEYVQQGDQYCLDYVYYYRTLSETGKGVNSYKVFPTYYRINARADYMVQSNVALFVDVQNLLNNQDMLYVGPLKGRTISFGFNIKY